MKLHHFLCLFAAFIPLFSCAGRVSGSLSADGSAKLAINMSLEPQMSSLIGRLSSAAGQTNGLKIDGPAIARSMSSAPGIASVSLRNTASAAVEGSIQISNLNEFLAKGGKEFITFEQKRCEIYICRDNGPDLLELLSPEISDYLNALMAPIASGEYMRKSDYLDLVTSIYNKAISNEIASSKIHVSIDFPGQITEVKGGTFSRRRAEFNISLLDLLVLDNPLIYEVRWR